MNFFLFFNGSCVSTPGSLWFQSDPVRLHKGMDCVCTQEFLVLKCKLLICNNYKVIKKPLAKLDCCEERTQSEDFSADIQFSL